ncbi:MAG TPA: phosphoribosylglycinamide synthetase C domain-containing protein, partial [Candidatus Angelobacter sp.]|nr:phosphoribosylglycinamide synthetase C domain-containing protein [Candidatus Angelobacter sp.]
SLIFHSGTKKIEGQWVTDGGRVLLVTRLAPTLEEAIHDVQEEMAKLDHLGTFFRRDIGHRALSHTK